MKTVLIAGNRDKSNTIMRNSYLEAVFSAGAVPVLGSASSAEQADAYARTFDALVLPGGNDLPAEMFGQARHVACTCDDPARDLSDRLLWEAFHAAGKRVLGICRGCQVVNVFCGGTLHQHLPDAYDPVLWHSGNAYGRHGVFIEPDSLLAQLFGGGERRVNSSHHQAIDRPGVGLRVTGRAPDGVTEAAEGENTLLVQFHPELMGEEGLGIFRWLVQ